MDAATKDALAYCSAANFGPYQYRQFRILEFPRYEEFAHQFPNTIPYSEEDRLHRSGSGPTTRGTSTIPTTSRPTRPRTSGGRTR